MKNVNLWAMIVMIVGLVIYVLVREVYAVGIYAAGAIAFAVTRLVAVVRHRSASAAVSRLPQIRLFSAAALLGVAYLMYDGSNSWSILLLVSAVIEVYVSFRES